MLHVEERPSTALAPQAALAGGALPTEQLPVASPVENAVAIPERPALAADVQLVGAMEGTGFQTRQWLVQRGDGYIQLSELLYRVVEQMNGERTIEEIAARVVETTGRPVSANNVRYLIEKRFVSLGLIEGMDDPAQPGGKAKRKRQQGMRGPLQLSLKIGFVGPRPVEAGARWLQYLFWPPLMAAVVLLAVGGQLWLFFAHGIMSTIQAILGEPILLLPVSTYVVLAALFHEYGHASALRYGGGRARGMGFGLYFTFPAFYTDCTEMYRLGRWARLRTDLGGIYFDMVNTVVLMGLYTLTHQPLLLAAVLLLDLEMVDQFDPVMRFDGYWALADLLGVPDFYVFMGPVLRGMIPKRWRPKGQEAPPLKGWVKIAFLAYTVIAVPVVFVTFASLLLLAPLFLVTYWNSLVLQWIDFATAWARHDTANSIVGGVQVVVLVLSAYFLGYAVYGLLRTIVRMLWKLGHADTRRQAGGCLVAHGGCRPVLLGILGAAGHGHRRRGLADDGLFADRVERDRRRPRATGATADARPEWVRHADGAQPKHGDNVLAGVGSTSQTSTSGVTTTKPASDPSASKSNTALATPASREHPQGQHWRSQSTTGAATDSQAEADAAAGIPDAATAADVPYHPVR